MNNEILENKIDQPKTLFTKVKIATGVIVATLALYFGLRFVGNILLDLFSSRLNYYRTYVEVFIFFFSLIFPIIIVYWRYRKVQPQFVRSFSYSILLIGILLVLFSLFISCALSGFGDPGLAPSICYFIFSFI